MPSVSDLRHSLEKLATAARDLHERGRTAFNEAEMLTSLAGLAANHKLQLEQMQPVLPTNKKPAPGPDEPPPPDDREIGYALTLKGEYAQLTAFLRAFAQTFPMAQVVSIRVSASMERDGPPILAILTTRHCAFDALPAARVAEAAAQIPE
jgi:hypothetical protein